MYEVTVACPQCRRQNHFFIPDQKGSKFPCASCHAIIVTVAPIQGFLYILSNKQMSVLIG